MHIYGDQSSEKLIDIIYDELYDDNEGEHDYDSSTDDEEIYNDNSSSSSSVQRLIGGDSYTDWGGYATHDESEETYATYQQNLALANWLYLTKSWRSAEHV